MTSDNDSIEMRAMKTNTNPWCACGNPTSSCDGTRRGCRHMSPRCRAITGAVNDDYCDWCRREQVLLARLEEMTR